MRTKVSAHRPKSWRILPVIFTLLGLLLPLTLFSQPASVRPPAPLPVPAGAGAPASTTPTPGDDAWKVVPSANAGAKHVLESVSALNETDAWAVGYRSAEATTDVTTTQTLILHWDGFNWLEVPFPTGSG